MASDVRTLVVDTTSNSLAQNKQQSASVNVYFDERCSEHVGKTFVIEIQTRKIITSLHLNISTSLLSLNLEFKQILHTFHILR